MRSLPAPLRQLVAACALTLAAGGVQAGAQQYEPMAASVRAALHLSL
ncbi:MAG TPA: transglycosylase, partial [Thauera sp.]|nr:transglycosylase [Thauera sp.]